MIAASTSKKLQIQIFSYQSIIVFTWWGLLRIFFSGTFSYKFRKDLPASSKVFECFCFKDKTKCLKSIVLNLVYRPSSIDHKELEIYFKSSLCLSLPLSISVPLSLSLCLSVSLSACLSLSVCLSICLSVCLSVCLSNLSI